MQNVRELEMSRLTAYIAMCEEGSISAAARRLSISQSALTVTLQKLEASLDAQLLTRAVHGVTTTEAGKLLLERAYEIVSLAETTFQDVKNRGNSIEGDVSIGLAASTAAVLAVPLIERIARTYPGIRLRIVEAFTGYLWQWLNAGQLDIAFVFDKTSNSEVECRPFATENLALIGAVGRLPATTFVSANSLKSYPLVMPTGLHSTRSALEAYAQRSGLALDIRMEIDAGQPLLSLIKTGKWFSILAPCALGNEPSPSRLAYRALRPALPREICLAQRRALTHSIACKAARQEMLEEATDLMTRGVWKAKLL